MSERYDLPRIPSATPPTPLNREAGVWGLVGSFVGGFAGWGIASLLATTAAWTAGSALVVGAGTAALIGAPVLGIALGIAHGGAKGRARQIDELQNGRVVKDPTYLNSGILSGFLMADVIGLTAVVGALVLGVTIAPVIAAGLAFLPLVAAITGSIMRQTSMQQDYDAAIRIRQQELATARLRAPEQAMGRAPTIYKDSVTAQETALLESKQAAAKTSFAETVQQPEQQAAAGR